MSHRATAGATGGARLPGTTEARGAPEPRATEPRPPEGRGWALLATSLGFAVVQLDVSVVNVAIKPIGEQFGSSLSGLQWVVSAYTVAFAALSAGPLVGGVLIATVGWRAIFFINAPIGAVGIWLTVRFARETSRSAARGIDLPGQATAILWLLALTAAVIEGGAHGFDDPAVLACFALSALAGACFLAVEARGRRPMLPLALFSSPTFSAATAIGLLINIAFYGLIFLLSLFFQRVQHHSSLATGLAFAPTTVAVLVSNLLAARLARAIGAGRTIALGGLVLAAGLAALLGIASSSAYVALVAQLVAIGAGLGLVVPAMTAALLGSVERSRSGVASGTLNTARQTGSVVGVALFGALAAGGLVAGLHAALLISIVLALGAAGLGAAIQLREARA